ncbi:MAG: hypothetical protein KKG75_03215 [Nanoarchaeota archaeon]|nr:hypothetical protein [Nanoarchaeota archaeon]
MKTEKKVVIFLSLLLIALVSFGIYVISTKQTTNPNEYIYNDFRVFKNPAIGYTVVAYLEEQPYHLQLRYDPKNVTDIPIDSRIRSSIMFKEAVFFTIDPDFNSIPVLGASELATILGRRLGIYDKRVFGAITKESENATEPSGNLIVDCDNVTQKSNIVRLQLGPETKVFLENNGCIIVQGTNEWEIVRASDRLIYHILEVIKD